MLLEQHRLQIIRYGDEKGIRDQSRLDAAMTCSKVVWGYGIRDLHLLAAKYADALVMGIHFSMEDCAEIKLAIDGIDQRAEMRLGYEVNEKS